MPTILLVEDDLALRRLMAVILEQEGYSVQAVGDGVTALHACRSAPPDLILLDLMLPELDGPGFLSALDHYRLPDIPVIVCSAQPERASRYKGKRIRGVISKPFDLTELLDLVKEQLRAPLHN